MDTLNKRMGEYLIWCEYRREANNVLPKKAGVPNLTKKGGR